MARLLRWKFWHWTIASMALGLVLSYFYGERDFVPRDKDARVDENVFWSEINGEPIGGVPAVSGVVLYPTHGDVQLITFKSAEPDSGGNAVVSARFFYSTRGDIAPRLAKFGTPFTRAWWTSPLWGDLEWSGGTILILGVVWPTFLLVLQRSGYGPPPEPKYDFSKFSSAPEEKKPPAPVVTHADRAKLADLEKMMEANLSAPTEILPADETPERKSPASSAPAPRKLDGGPITLVSPDQAQDKKEYDGVYYPVEHPKPKKSEGFTIVELLVVIGVMAILIAMLMPVLAGAQQASMQIVCASNLRTIGQGFSVYLSVNGGAYPPAYTYVGETTVNGVEEDIHANLGHVHWSSYLLGAGAVSSAVFHCPALDQGGITPTATTSDNLEPGQFNGSTDGQIDQQAPRLAYTVNEAICPRNKFYGYPNVPRYYQYVKMNQITHPSETILATEWGPAGARVPGPPGSGFLVFSHCPVCGFVANNGGLDFYELPPGTGFRQATAADLDPDPGSAPGFVTAEINWVGRNHGRRFGYPDRRLTNFLYVDGHVETKSVYDTLVPFQWGEQFWSLHPNNDMETP